MVRLIADVRHATGTGICDGAELRGPGLLVYQREVEGRNGAVWVRVNSAQFEHLDA